MDIIGESRHYVNEYKNSELPHKKCYFKKILKGTAIPTLSEWGIIIFMTVMLAIGVMM
ncbi:MAG: IPTL-CTERM sorting domain-containing protein, partial [Deltaproteobacteria bacterium]|nr:IPTL-CTERM sorting domain-containing protein [Deltaproteobacteria bacterium]